jgi:hypothetical protein
LSPELVVTYFDEMKVNQRVVERYEALHKASVYNGKMFFGFCEVVHRRNFSRWIILRHFRKIAL